MFAARGRCGETRRADQADERQPPIKLGAGENAKGRAKQRSCGALRRALAQARRGQPHDLLLGRLARERSPVWRPSHMTNTRSDSNSSSGISELTTTIPESARRQRENELIDLLLRPHVDAAGRLVEQQNAGLGRRATCR